MENFPKAKSILVAQHPFCGSLLCYCIHSAALPGCLLLYVLRIPQALIMAAPAPALLHDFSLHCSLPHPLSISLLTVSSENLISFMLLLHQTMSCIAGQPPSQLPLGQMANTGSISWHVPKHNCSLSR